MRRTKLVLGLLAIVLFSVNLVPADPGWSYLEAGYIDFDPEGGLDDDGWYAEGTRTLFRSFHLFAEYDDVGDVTLWNVGAGWHGLLWSKGDLFAEVSWNDVEIDASGVDVDDDGQEVAVGARWQLFPWLELKGQINRIDLDQAGDDTGFEVEALLSGPGNRLGIGLNLESNDDETLKAFLRFNFGR